MIKNVLSNKGINFLLLFLFFVLSLSYSSTNTFSVSAGAEMMSGYTLYKIGGSVTLPDGSGSTIPLSQLKFPLNTYLLRTEAELNFLDNFNVKLCIKKSLTSDAGKTEDSDWGYWYLSTNSWADSASPSTLDIFSTSDTSINFFSIEGMLLYTVFSGSWYSAAFGGAFLFQYFYFDISNLDQWYPSYEQYKSYLTPDYANHILIPGKVGSYELRQYIPYFNMAGNIFSDLFKLYLMLGFSPIAICADRDDHILRSKEMNAFSTGSAYIAGANLSLNFTSALSISINGEFMYVMTSGNQTQTRYENTSEGPAGLINTVGYNQESLQFNAGLSAGFGF